MGCVSELTDGCVVLTTLSKAGPRASKEAIASETLVARPANAGDSEVANPWAPWLLTHVQVLASTGIDTDRLANGERARSNVQCWREHTAEVQMFKVVSLPDENFFFELANFRDLALVLPRFLTFYLPLNKKTGHG